MESSGKYLMFFTFVLLFSCKQPVIREPEFIGTRNISLNKLGLKNSEMDMEMGFFNPNGFGLALDGFDLDVYMNGDYLGKARDVRKTMIPGNDTFHVPVRMEVGMKNILSQGLSLGLNREADIRIKGIARLSRANKSAMIWQIPVDYQTRYRLK
jgi:LEA14-like dessication related protein